MSTTTTVNFRELLKQPTDAAERPKALAVGHYVGTIKGHEFGLSKQKQTPFVRFFLTPEEEYTDVADGANAGIDLSKRDLRRDFYLTPTALYRLSDFLDAVLGKQTGRSFDVRIPETRGVRVMFQVTQRENDEKTEVYNDIGSVIRTGE